MATKAERKEMKLAAAEQVMVAGPTSELAQAAERVDQLAEQLDVTEQPVVASPQAAILAVKPGMVYRGARAQWYALLVQYDGKPVWDFLAAAQADRPSKYGARSKLCGTPEPVKGWLRFFTRTGVAKY